MQTEKYNSLSTPIQEKVQASNWLVIQMSGAESWLKFKARSRQRLLERVSSFLFQRCFLLPAQDLCALGRASVLRSGRN